MDRCRLNPELIEERLYRTRETLFQQRPEEEKRISAVMFLIGEAADGEASVILTKRSSVVSQPGDLCSPGGRISPRIDPVLARLLTLPATPLTRWRYWRELRSTSREEAARLALVSATALRESWEEIRLKPPAVRILGPLRPQRLITFNKTIFPVCGAIRSTAGLKPNAEVERILSIPLRALLDSRNYAAYQLTLPGGEVKTRICFVHSEGERQEILWGATLSITHTFLARVAAFEAPPLASLPVVEREIEENYFRQPPAF